MIRRRAKPDGLPFRVYENYGPRTWSVWYQPLHGPRDYLYKEMPQRHSKAEARRIALNKFNERMGLPQPEPLTFASLWILYRDWQDGLSDSSTGKKAQVTLDSERDHVKPLIKVFGKVAPDDILFHHWTKYQDARSAQGVGPVINKEIALASSILGYGKSRGICLHNTAQGVKRITVYRKKNLLTLARIDECMPVAQARGPQAIIQLLAVRCALLCLKRPIEIRGLTRSDLLEDGVRFTETKLRRGVEARFLTITWSDELRATIEAAKAVPRKVAVSPYIFSTEDGHMYSKTGWASNWRRFMDDCEAQIPGFVKFTLRDSRSGGVTKKEAEGHADTQTATMHKSRKMIESVYDLNTNKKATPAA